MMVLLTVEERCGVDTTRPWCCTGQVPEFVKRDTLRKGANDADGTERC
jgi:hypothetical protein